MRAAAVAAALTASAATPLGRRPVGFPGPAPRQDSYRWHVLVDGPERISLRSRPGGRVELRGRNPTGAPIADFNRRQVFTATDGVPTQDQHVCATWTRQSEPVLQQGLAVRVRSDAGGRQRAVTLTKNTFANYFWVFNLLTWDTRRAGDPWRALGQFDMSDVVVADGRWVPLPWRVCLRVKGRTLTFKVWLPRQEAEPTWRDPVHSRRITLKQRFVFDGEPGWYIGHLPPGQSAEYADLTS